MFGGDYIQQYTAVTLKNGERHFLTDEGMDSIYDYAAQAKRRFGDKVLCIMEYEAHWMYTPEGEQKWIKGVEP